MSKGITISEEEFLKESLGIVEKAQEKNIILRILGALAVYLKSEHCPRCRELHKSLGRLEGGAVFTDLDLIGVLFGSLPHTRAISESMIR